VDVDWIEAADNYVTLHAGVQTYPARETMGRLERELDPERFVRIHRSAIVQVDRIKELPAFRGDFVVVLRNGARVTLSRTYRRKVEAILRREL
jgi:two-component system LytT family response regulator